MCWRERRRSFVRMSREARGLSGVRRSETMSRKTYFWLLGTTLIGIAGISEAQQTAKIPRIGYLSVSSLSAMADRIEAFRQGLRELGYAEGKNIIVEWRYGEEKPDRVSEL